MAEDVKVLLDKLERLYQIDPEAFDRVERRLDEYLAESEMALVSATEAAVAR